MFPWSVLATFMAAQSGREALTGSPAMRCTEYGFVIAFMAFVALVAFDAFVPLCTRVDTCIRWVHFIPVQYREMVIRSPGELCSEATGVSIALGRRQGLPD